MAKPNPETETETKPAAPEISAREQSIRRRIAAGLSRAQAEEVETAQEKWDASQKAGK